MGIITEENENDLISEVLDMMQPRIKKMLQQTNSQYRDDLEQEIKLKAIIAIKTKRIQPISFIHFKENFDERLRN